MVETANDALAKLAELTEAGHAEVVAKDMSGAIIGPGTLRAEADRAVMGHPPAGRAEAEGEVQGRESERP